MKTPDEIKKGHSFSEYLDEMLPKVNIASLEEEQEQKKRTPEEIKMGLECCIEGRCSKCPYEQVCDKHLADGGDTIPTAEPLADFLTLIQQLERERDAAVGSLKRYAACLDCTHYRQEAFGYQQPICQGCKFGSNWQWRGVQEVE